MERTTSCSSAVGSSSAIVKQADGSNIFQQRARSVNPFSVSPQVPWWSRAGDAPLITPHVEKPCQRGHAQSLLSPPSFFPPSSGLVSVTLGVGSGSAAVGDNSLSIHGPVTTSQSIPSSYFLALDTVDLQVPSTNTLPAALGGQPWPGIVPPSGGLASAPSFGSGSATVGDNPLSVHGHTTMSQSLPLSFFPTLGAVDLQVSATTPLPVALDGHQWQGMMPSPSNNLISVAGFGPGSMTVGEGPTLNTVDLQVPVGTPFPVALDGQPWEGMVSPPPSGLVSASRFGSGSAAVRYNSLSVNGHAETSQSSLSSFFPTLGLPDLQAPVATPLQAALGSQAWQGLAPPPSSTALGLPTCPSQGTFAGQSAALEQMAAWQQSEMPFFLPAAVSNQPPPSSSDNRVGFTQPSSSNYELPPLPPSLRIPPPEEENTYSMLNTINGTIIPWHYGDSSMGIGISTTAVPNLTAGAMKAPMSPLMAPTSSQGLGAGSSKFTGFAAQPSLNSELAALRAGLQAHLQLPVKQEPIGNEEDRPDQAVIQRLMAEKEKSISRGLVGWESTKVAGSTPCQNSNSTPKLSQPLTLRADASSSRSHGTRVIFTDAEKEIIRKDKSLQGIVNADPKRVKRMLSNRMSAAKRKATKDVLESKVETLERKRKTLSAELQLAQGQRAELETQHKELRMTMQEMEQQGMLKDAVSEKLQAQIQTPNLIKLNELQMSSQKNTCPGSSWFPPTKHTKN
ncbi:unnamed protein product [Urochloa decumbens]|uniref:BZIP domain-containing protein n=1 Tax=Urochloa decumbens TaxID=240449 RepID=A0ABC9B9J0_9POAL